MKDSQKHSFDMILARKTLANVKDGIKHRYLTNEDLTAINKILFNRLAITLEEVSLNVK